MPRRRLRSEVGRRAFVHAIAHIELNAIDLAWLEEIHPDRVSTAIETTWNDRDQAVEQAEVHRYDAGEQGALVYHRAPRAEVDPAAAEEILVGRIAAGQLRLESACSPTAN